MSCIPCQQKKLPQGWEKNSNRSSPQVPAVRQGLKVSSETDSMGYEWKPKQVLSLLPKNFSSDIILPVKEGGGM
jgi:hypothetical protein